MKRGRYSLRPDGAERAGVYWLRLGDIEYMVGVESLGWLAELAAWALAREFNRCEGCGRKAVTADSEGVPLCRACFNALDPAETPPKERR